MRTALIISAIATVATLAQPASADSKFDGKTSVVGEVGGNNIVVAIGQDIDNFSQVGGIRGTNTFRGDVNVNGNVRKNNIVVAIGQNVNNYSQVGGIDSK